MNKKPIVEIKDDPEELRDIKFFIMNSTSWSMSSLLCKDDKKRLEGLHTKEFITKVVHYLRKKVKQQSLNMWERNIFDRLNTSIPFP